MRKTNLIKVVTILLISAMVMLFTTTVNAAENDTGFTDLTSTLNNTNTNNVNTNTANTNTNTNTNNTNTSTNQTTNRVKNEKCM